MKHYLSIRKFIFNRIYILTLIIFSGIQAFGQENTKDICKSKPDQTSERRMTVKKRPLLVGKTVERKLNNNERHLYFVHLRQGQILRINVEEIGVDIAVALYQTKADQKISSADLGSGYMREVSTNKISSDGDYYLTVETQQTVAKGRYKILADIKGETSNDVEQIKAENLLAEGFRSRDKDTADGIKEAIEKWTEALNIWRRLAENYWVGYTNNALGTAHYSIGENLESLKFYNAALSTNQIVKNNSLKSAILNNIGAAYFDSGKRKTALDFYFQSLTLKRNIGDKSGEATTLNNIGEIFSALGEKEKALQYFNQALTAKRIINHKNEEAAILNNIGEVLSSLGKNQEALDFYNKAFDIYKTLVNKRGEAVSLFNIGSIFYTLGEKQTALQFYDRALAINECLGEKSGTALTKIGIGEVYFSLGESRKALANFDQALETVKFTDYENIKALALNNIGRAYSSLGNREEALSHYNQSLELVKFAGDEKGMANELNNIGSVYIDKGENLKALEALTESLSKSLAIGDRQGQAATLGNLAYLSLVFEDPRQSTEFLHKALTRTRITKDKNGEALWLGNLMFAWNTLGNQRLAIFFGKQSVNKSQQLRRSARSPDIESAVQKSFLKTVDDRYKYLAELLINQKNFELAIQVMNLYQDQQFFDFNFDASSPVKQVALTPREQVLADRYESAVDLIARISSPLDDLKRRMQERPLNNDEKKTLEKLESELNSAAAEYLKVFKDAELEFSEKPDKND